MSLQQAIALIQSEPLKAQQLLDELLALTSSNWQAMYYRAKLFSKQNHFDSAIELLERAIALNPAEKELRLSLAIVQHQKGDLDAAIIAYNAALTIDKNCQKSQFNLANVYFSLGQLNKAIEFYQQVLQRTPNHHNALNNLSTAYYQSNQFEQAKFYLSQAISIPRNYSAFNILGMVFYAESHFEESVLNYLSALEIEKNDPSVWSNLSSCYFEMGRNSEALNSIETALKLQPHDAEYQLSRCLFLTALKEPSAEQFIVELIRRTDTTTYIRNTAFALYPLCLNEKGQSQQAVAFYNFKQFIYQATLDLNQQQRQQLENDIQKSQTLEYEPDGANTHKGRQTRSLLLDNFDSVNQLIIAIKENLKIHFSALKTLNDDHPFLQKIPEKARIKIWSVLLDSEGHQNPHMHPKAFLSGVYYLKVPKLPEAHSSAGNIVFGKPEKKLFSEVKPIEHEVATSTNALVFFPSYFFHHTIPITHQENRISIAFDIIPFDERVAVEEGVSKVFSIFPDSQA